MTKVSAAGSLPHFAPADQPTSVRQLAERLFSAYTLDDGSVHLAGCSLEDRPFVRWTFEHGGATVEVLVDDHARLVDDDTARRLGLGETVRLEHPPDPTRHPFKCLVDQSRHLVQQRYPAVDLAGSAKTALIWCKFAEGKLRFTFGDGSVDLPFFGWARSLQPPPFVCPHTGKRTFHLAATDDGRIAAAEAVRRCDETGSRVLDADLAICAVTGKTMLRELLATCPVSGEQVARKQLLTCSICLQEVSPHAIDGNACSACRNLRPVAAGDVRLDRVLARYPALAGWSKWRLSETARVYVLRASRWWKRLLVVVDKQSLAPLRLARGRRFQARWTPLERDQWEQELGSGL